MKKLFGILCVFLSVLLTACNVGLLSERSGSIDFSIPADQVISLANSYAARNGENKPDGGFIFLAQIKGNRGYYQYQTKTVTLAESELTNWDPDQQLQDSTNYLSKKNLNFSFSGLPIGQKYTVMFDMLVSPKESMPTYAVFSGKTTNVKVTAGKAADVGIKVSNVSSANSPVLVELRLADGTKRPFNSLSYLGSLNSNSQGSVSLKKEFGELMFYPEPNADPIAVKDICCVINSDTNFDASKFRYSIIYGDIDNPSYYDLNFKNNICSIKNFFLKTVKFSKEDITNNECEFTNPGLLRISNASFSWTEAMRSIEMKSSDEFLTGQIKNETLTFEKKNYDGGQVLLYVEPVNDLLNVSLGGTDFDTAVLFLKTRGSNLVSTGTQLYYKLDEDQSGSLPFNYGQEDDEINGSTLFYNNKCINHKTGENKFVLPFNQVDYPNGAWYLVLFVPYDGDSETVDISVDIDYCVFPQRFGVHVFGVGQAYDSEGKPTGGYRYETNIPLYSSLEGGKNYKAGLRGYVCSLSLSDGYFSKKSITLNGELYNSSNEESFYPLSNGNPPSFQTYTGQDETINEFIFSNIREPKLNADRYFMCTAPCEDVNTILVVKDYSFECNDS